MLFSHHLEVCFNNYNQFSDQLYNNLTFLFSLMPSTKDQMAEIIPHFLQVAMLRFESTTRILA